MIAAEKVRTPRNLTKRSWTVQELESELPETNLPVELWDGELVMSPAPFFSHQEIVMRISVAMSQWVSAHKIGKVVAAPIDMVLTDRRVCQPDVLFIHRDRLGIIKGKVMGPGDIVVEVISPESRRRDRIDKRDRYEQHEIPEYWIVDPEAETVEVLVLKRGQYELFGRWGVHQTARSSILKGFELDVGELFRSLSD